MPMATEETFESKNPGTATATNKRAVCEAIGDALNDGGVGDIVSKHEKLILEYYEDVKRQATESFKFAKLVAYIGFAVLIITWLSTLGVDLAQLLPKYQDTKVNHHLAVSMGAVSGALIEFIAGVNFWLYSKASKQFSAFHICLERTHRYLVAYKIAEDTGTRKDEVLEKLVCIMASAPMITAQNTDPIPNQAEPAKS